MQALLAEVSQIWSNGGSCSAQCMHTALALVHCHNAMAAKLLAAHSNAQSLERWAFFISDGDQRHCIQLASANGVMEMGWSATGVAQHTAEQDMGAPVIHLQHGHECTVGHEKQQMEVRGAVAAQMILDQHPNHYAALTLAHMQVPGFDKPMHFHMWRTDILTRVQSQLGLPDAASVPFKVWRRLRRTSYAHTIDLPTLPCWPVVVSLLCWQCGAMPANLMQCGGCCTAWYCSRDCQRAQHSSHKRWCSGVADEVRLQLPLSESPNIQSCTADMHAAVQRSPEGAALCYQMRQATQPAASGGAAVAASASGAAAAQAADGRRVPVQPAGVESAP